MLLEAGCKHSQEGGSSLYRTHQACDQQLISRTTKSYSKCWVGKTNKFNHKVPRFFSYNYFFFICESAGEITSLAISQKAVA